MHGTNQKKHYVVVANDLLFCNGFSDSCVRVAIPGLVGALGGYGVVGAFQQRHFMLVMSPLDVPCDHEELLCFVTDVVTKIFLYYGFFTTDSVL